MIRLLIALACVATVLGTDESRVVGGYPAGQGQFPYQISMRLKNGGHYCGGTIISSRTIVTAAHCVYGHYASEFYIVVGSNYLNSGGDSYALSNLVYHPSFDSQNIVNDVALLMTSQDIRFNSYVKPLNLPSSDTGTGVGVTVSGWGLTSTGGNVPNSLQYANLRTIDMRQCAQALAPGVVTTGSICTFTQYGQGTCNGDSGGPLAAGGTLVGIVSWGRPCAQGYPDVFTRVYFYVSWIRQYMV